NNLRPDFQHARSREGGSAGDQFVQQCTESEEVAAAIDVSSGCLLRREIQGSADDDVAARMCGIDRVGIEIHARGWLFKQVLHQTEVEYFHLTAIVDDDVRGFDVAMYDALFVCFRKCLGYGT